MGNFSTDSFPSNRWTNSDVLSDLAECIQSIDEVIRFTFGFSTSSLTAPFAIADDGSIVAQTSIAIGTSNAMIDIVDAIPASPGANETLKLATVDAIRDFLDVQRLPGTNIDLSTSNFDNNLSGADDTAQKAFDTLDDIDLDNLFHFDESDEFSGVSVESIVVADRIIFEDQSDSWAKKYTTVTQFASVVSGSSHTIASHSDTTATGAELEELTDGSNTYLHEHPGYVSLGARADIEPLPDTTYGWLIAEVPISNTKYKISLSAFDYSFITAQDGSTNVTSTELEELSDGSETALHIHDARYYTETETDALLDPLQDFFNGTFVESFDATVTSDGGTVTMSLEQSGTGDLTMRFSDGDTALDCTDPVQTIALTAGAGDDTPQENYIYIPQSTKVLTKHTSQWPAAEHIRVGYFLVPTAAEVQTNGCYINQNWNDHRMGTDSQGHLAHLGAAIRLTMGGAKWHSGVAANASGSEYLEVTGTSPSVVEFKSTAGVAYQMHKHTVPAVDMSGGDECLVVNWNGDAYHNITDLADITVDASGAALSNKWFNLVFWGVANKTGEYAPLMVNLPTGSYVTQASAEADLDNHDVTTIPHNFTADSCTGFLICRVTCRQDPSGTWTLGNTVDLRGSNPSTTAGGGVGGGALTDFPDNQFTLYDADDVTRVVNWELGGITTGNTRTLTAPDESGTIALVANVLPLAGGTMSGDILLASGIALDTSADHDLLFYRNNILKMTVGANTFDFSAGPLRIDGGLGADIQVWDGTSDYNAAIYANGAAALEFGDAANCTIKFMGTAVRPNYYDNSVTTDLALASDLPLGNSGSIKINVSNDSGSEMNKGDLVYISGDSSGVPQVTLADADAEASASKMLVMINETIANSADGEAVVKGFVTGLSGFTAGAIQYVSLTAGELTETAPSATADIVRIVGYAFTTTELFFDPDKTYVEIV